VLTATLKGESITAVGEEYATLKPELVNAMMGILATRANSEGPVQSYK